MIDIKLVRANPQALIDGLARRNSNLDITELLDMDKERRELTFEADTLKSKQNEVSKQIPMLKKEGKDTTAIFEEMKQISDRVKVLDARLSELEATIENLLLSIPNIPHESVPTGKDESDNVEVRRYGTPKEFDFEPKAHWDLGENLGILDFAAAAKISGARFTLYKDAGAKLERAIINFFLDTHTETSGYTEVFPPFMVNRDSMRGTGQLPKFEEDAFLVSNNGYFMIPTAEVPVTNIHRDEILSGAQLPILYSAYSACFRAEAGSAGRDTRGLIRQHQFNKVELVKFSRPEDSYDELEKLTADAEKVLQLLGLPYRVSLLCSGDMGFSSAKTYDIEVWMPSYNRYVEISSCSNFDDFQARRANIRFKDNQTDKAQFVHTLNGSGVAIGRTVAAILENYQNADGSITVPDVLVKYMYGRTSIEK